MSQTPFRLALLLLLVSAVPAATTADAQTVQNAQSSGISAPRRQETITPETRRTNQDTRRLNRIIRMQTYNGRMRQQDRLPSKSRPANAKSPRSTVVPTE